jgi:hypothetical protein
MISQSPLDIFRVESHGVLWIESAPTLEDAKARVQQLAARESAEYVVLNQLTGDKFVFNASRASVAPDRTRWPHE